jgi:hypothetical protein
MTKFSVRRGGLRSRVAAAAMALAVGAAVLVGWAAPAHAGAITSTPRSGFNYYLKLFNPNDPTSRCADVQGASTIPFTAIQLWTCGPQWNQQFFLWYVGIVNGKQAWHMQPRHATNLCVAVDGGSHNSGTPYVVEQCNSYGWEQDFALQQGWEAKNNTNDVWWLIPVYELGVTMSVSAYGAHDGASLIGENPFDNTTSGEYDFAWQIYNSVP